MNLVEYASVIVNATADNATVLVVGIILFLAAALFTLRHTGPEIILLFVIGATAFASLGLGVAFNAIQYFAFGLALLFFGIMIWKNFMGG